MHTAQSLACRYGTCTEVPVTFLQGSSRRTSHGKHTCLHMLRHDRSCPARKSLQAKAHTFEPQLDPSVLAAQLSVLGLTVTAGAYWWFVVVPSERAALAKSKRKGQVGQYLQQLEASPERRLERWFYTDWLKQRQKRMQRPSAWGASTDFARIVDGRKQPDNSTPSEQETELDKERQSTSTGLEGLPNPDVLKPSYNTPTPRFLSLDNPIVVAGVLLLLCFLASAVTS